MRLAYVTAKFPFGPTEAFFEPEVRQLAKLLDEVVVYPTRPATRSNLYGDLGATNVYLPTFGFSVARDALLMLVRAPRSVARALAIVLRGRSRPAATLKNLLVFPHALALAADLRRRGIQHVHVQWLTTPATSVLVAAFVAKLPWSASAHQHDIFFENLVAEKVRAAAFVRVISARNRRHLVARADAADAARCYVVHLGVEVPVVPAPIPERPILRLVCAARLWHFKGHPYLLRALRLVADAGVRVHCDLAGDGELRPAIEALVRDLQLQDVVSLRGHVPHAQLLAELRRGEYDFSVLASTEDAGEHEGIPVALMEAMAAGVPVLATRSGSMEELIEDGISGLLVPHKDSRAFADAILRLAGDVELRAQLARRARARILADFDTVRTTRQLATLLDIDVPDEPLVGELVS